MPSNWPSSWFINEPLLSRTATQVTLARRVGALERGRREEVRHPPPRFARKPLFDFSSLLQPDCRITITCAARVLGGVVRPRSIFLL
jgi:hypothetical protein